MQNDRVIIKLNKYPNFIKKNQYIVIYDTEKEEVYQWVHKNILIDHDSYRVCARSGIWPTHSVLLRATKDIYIKENNNAE